MLEKNIDDIQRGDQFLSFGTVAKDEEAPKEPDKEEKETPPSPSEEPKPTEDTPPSHQGGEGGAPKEEGEKPKEEGEEDKGKKPLSTDDDNEKLPFHKHPRWKALNDDKRQLEETVEDLKKRLEETEQKVSKPRESEDKAPDWFVKAYGDDPEEYEKFKSMESHIREKIKGEISDDLKKSEKTEVDLVSKWEKWIDTNLQKLEEDGKEFDKNELLKVLDEYRPTDSKGSLDFKKAFEILDLRKKKEKEEKQKKSEVKKKVASGTIDQGKPIDSSKETILTPADLRGKSFHDLIKS
ncbi:MAG: hypothetical protein WCW77_00540 [Patescibacteria group bacterium]|jgi:hypothetical protein